MFFEIEHFPGPGRIALTEVTGRAELGVGGIGGGEAIRFLDAMMTDHSAAVLGAGEAAKISISDRDRAMAQLQISLFGRRIAGDGKCRSCEERFDFDFDLADLVNAVATPEPVQTDDAGWISTGTGLRFRLPTGEDELAAAGLDAAAASNLIALRCVPEGTSPELRIAIEKDVQRLAPLVDLTLDTTCPECGAANPMDFSAERFFLSSIRNERRLLLSEIHHIALSYGWTFDTIIDLPRMHRRELVAQIERHRGAVQRSGAA